MRKILPAQAKNIRASILLVVLFCCSYSYSAYGQVWDTVGDPCFSSNNISENSLAIDKEGTPYLAFNDTGNITVMKFDGSKWINVGAPAFAGGGAYYLTLAIDTAGIPYVAFADYNNDAKAVVMKYDGSDWVNVGIPGFSTGGAYTIFLAIDGANTPYVVYSDDITGSGANVMKFDGTNWVLVGVPGFSASNMMHPALTFGGGGTPYVVFLDASTAFSTVMKFDGVKWGRVGGKDFAAPTYRYTPTIAVGIADTPYIAFTSNSYPYYSILMKYNGISWVKVGSNNVSTWEAHFTSMVFDKDKIPYVAYEDWSTPKCRVTVRKYDGTKWVNVGNTSFSEDTALDVHIAIDRNGTPYVAYSSLNTSKPTVMRLRSTIGIKEIGNPVVASLSVSPNPNHGQFTITIPSAANEYALVSVTDIAGRQVAAFNAATNNATSVSLSLPAGTYLLNVRTQSVNLHEKIVVVNQ